MLVFTELMPDRLIFFSMSHTRLQEVLNNEFQQELLLKQQMTIYKLAHCSHPEFTLSLSKKSDVEEQEHWPGRLGPPHTAILEGWRIEMKALH